MIESESASDGAGAVDRHGEAEETASASDRA